MISIIENQDFDRSALLSRETSSMDVSAIVKEIIATVRESGDEALRAYAEKFDKVVEGAMDSIEVTQEEIEEAFSMVDDELLDIMREAAQNITEYHECQLRRSYVVNEREGVVLGQKISPLDTVGLYVPGGTAAYPSSVLMNALPAKITGCPHIVMITPPGKDGKITPAILAAAKIAGVDHIYKSGGAQAVAALAYGTETIPRVDKIVGPGNAFVAEAKRQVFGQVSIDMIAGPSEILVVADESCSAKVIAADLLSQAEHDKIASAILITPSQKLAEEVQAEIELQLSQLEREEIARASIDNYGKIVLVDSIDEAIELSNLIAPEHLELAVDNPFDVLNKVAHAGSVFMGKYCPEALGDYLAGPNHVLPTSGTARFSSALSVDDFIKKTQFTYFSKEALAQVSDKVWRFAQEEGLTAHAHSAVVRFED